MTIQSLPLSSILPPEGNPRTAIDPAGIESLAASIQADGLLQNLVVLQLKGRKPRYRLISGEPLVRCPAQTRFKDWVLQLRGGRNTIEITVF